MISKQIAFLSRETAGQPDEILGGIGTDTGGSASKRRGVSVYVHGGLRGAVRDM